MTRRPTAILASCALVLALGASAAAARSRDVPDGRLTPGALDPEIVQATIGQTICRPGWARSVRPPRRYIDALKRLQMARAGLARDRRPFEEDHLVPLELGGAPADPRNLWPEPRFGTWSAAAKDRLGARLHFLVCRGLVPLAAAQRAFLAPADWRLAFCRYVGGKSCETPR